ncbi:carboxypeptidase regulatory-like domain-containing protein [Bremerella sp. JC770]|uniref:carboxypeptidase regulatory-like domain-containing protein n=1 Tax=Bremerella sp. JC770 TaxID=3232137 RepID=UPI0034577636
MCVSHAIAKTVVSLILISGIGCRNEPPKPDNMPELHPVSLTIVQEGEPLELASIRLIPQSQPSPWYSGGSTDHNGLVQVHTHGKYFGVPAGTYKVTVTKIEMPAAASGSLENMERRTRQEDTYDLVDPQYSNPTKTPLLLDVVPGSNSQEFDLGAPVRVKRKGPPS